MLKQLYFFLVCLLWTTVNASRFDVEHALVLYDPELLPLNDTSSLTPEVAQFIEYLSDKFDVKISDYNRRYQFVLMTTLVTSILYCFHHPRKLLHLKRH